jgi:hypothetical protein
MSRIVNAGGFVNAVGRINGNLNLSRSLGDLKYKQVVQCAREEQVRDVVFRGSVSARVMVLLDVSYFTYPVFPLADDHRGAGHHADAAAGGRPLLHPGLRRRVGLPLQPAGGTSAVTLCLSVCDSCVGCSMALSGLFADAVSPSGLNFVVCAYTVRLRVSAAGQGPGRGHHHQGGAAPLPGLRHRLRGRRGLLQHDLPAGPAQTVVC